MQKFPSNNHARLNRTHPPKISHSPSLRMQHWCSYCYCSHMAGTARYRTQFERGNNFPLSESWWKMFPPNSVNLEYHTSSLIIDRGRKLIPFFLDALPCTCRAPYRDGCEYCGNASQSQISLKVFRQSLCS